MSDEEASKVSDPETTPDRDLDAEYQAALAQMTPELRALVEGFVGRIQTQHPFDIDELLSGVDDPGIDIPESDLKPSGLIDREAALDAVFAQAQTEREQLDSIWKAQRRETKAGRWQHGKWVGLIRATDILRALPAIGTCATCAEWHDWRGSGKPFEGVCHAEIFEGTDGRWTPPDFYCAAYKPQEPRP